MPQPCPAVPRIARRALLPAVLGAALLTVPALAQQPAGGAEAGSTQPAPAPAAAPAPAPAPAAAPAASPLTRATIRTVQRKLRVHADGKLGPRTRAAIRRFQRRHGLPVDGRLRPATLAALDVTGRAASVLPAAAAPTGETARILAAIAQCESGGDPTRVSPSGRYRGKYQFSLETWAHTGGSGDPAAAPEAEQDQRAAALYAAEGTAPWPECGKAAMAKRRG